MNDINNYIHYINYKDYSTKKLLQEIYMKHEITKDYLRKSEGIQELFPILILLKYNVCNWMILIIKYINYKYYTHK